MNQCRTFQRLKLQLYYRELSQDAARTLLQHSETCSDCRESWHHLLQDMEILKGRSCPDPGETFWASYWDTIADRINRESRASGRLEETGGGRRAPAAPGWIIRPAAAVLLLVIGIIIGRHLMPGAAPRAPEGDTGAAAVSRRYARQQTVELLGQSKVMLLGFANFDVQEGDISTLNVPLQRQKSAAMLRQASSLREQLNAPEDGRLERLLADLEFILLQIANLEEEDGKTAVDIIRSSVDERSILFKITVQEIKETRSPDDSGLPGNSTV